MQTQKIEMEDLIRKYCKAWNNLNVGEIADEFHDDIEHHSQVILEVLKGKPKVVDYLKKKFEAIKSGDEPVKMYPVKHQNVLCAALFQLIVEPQANPFAIGLGNKKKPYRFGVIAFKFQDNKISQTCFCIIPTFEEVEFV